MALIIWTNEYKAGVVSLDADHIDETYQHNPSAAISGEIVKLLAAWLEDHVLETDIRYRPFLSEG